MKMAIPNWINKYKIDLKVGVNKLNWKKLIHLFINRKINRIIIIPNKLKVLLKIRKIYKINFNKNYLPNRNRPLLKELNQTKLVSQFSNKWKFKFKKKFNNSRNIYLILLSI